MEVEENRQLAFLHMTVHRNEDQSLSTEWYSKPIASGRILNFRSFHQPKYKMNVANNFIHRVSSLTRNRTFSEIHDTIHKHLRANDYPKTLINILIHRYSNRTQKSIAQSDQATPNHPPLNNQQSAQPGNQTEEVHQPPPPAPPLHQQPSQPPQIQQPHIQPPPHQQHPNNQRNIPQQTGILKTSLAPQTATNAMTTPEPKMYRSVPYVPSLTQRITKMLAPDHPQVTISSRQHSTIYKLHSRVKDPVRKEDKCNIIYKIPCNDCESCYVGMTQNKLKTRLAGHKTNINKLNQLVAEGYTSTSTEIVSLRDKTALIEHAIDHDHSFNIDNTTIIDHSNKVNTLPFLEMCHISNTTHTVNKRTDVDGLSTSYAAILHTIKNKFSTKTNKLNRPARP